MQHKTQIVSIHFLSNANASLQKFLFPDKLVWKQQFTILNEIHLRNTLNPSVKNNKRFHLRGFCLGTSSSPHMVKVDRLPIVVDLREIIANGRLLGADRGMKDHAKVSFPWECMERSKAFPPASRRAVVAATVDKNDIVVSINSLRSGDCFEDGGGFIPSLWSRL